jgi:hypothetical protein
MTRFDWQTLALNAAFVAAMAGNLYFWFWWLP